MISLKLFMKTMPQMYGNKAFFWLITLVVLGWKSLEIFRWGRPIASQCMILKTWSMMFQISCITQL